MKKLREDIKNAVLASKTAILAAHVDPDGDTLGSMIAMALLLEKLGLKCTLYSPDGVPHTYRFLPQADRVVDRVPKVEFDLLITVDASDISRVGRQKIKAKKIINIDHHPDNTNFGDINYVELLSAVAEQVYKLALDFGVGIDQDIATALYISIITDTGNFRYSNTLPSTFEVAKQLVERGANPTQCANLVYDNRSLAGLKVLAAALENVETVKKGKVVYSVVTHQMVMDTKAHGEDLVGIIDHLRTLESAEVAIMFREERRGLFKINLRSKGAVNVSRVAKALGGGGHVQASGCEVEGDIEEIKKKVLDLVLKEF